MKTERFLASYCYKQNRLGCGVSPCWLLFTLLPCAVALLQPCLSGALQGASAQSSCSSAPALASGCEGLFLTVSFIAHRECFALSEQMLSLRHCRHGSGAQLNPAVAALELSGTICVHCPAALDTPHAGLLAVPTSIWAAAPHKTSSGGSHYVLTFLFWNNTKYSVLKFIPANTEGRYTEV